MALNPFFLQGSSNEQYLVQDLINEQLKIYGVEIYYLPRKFVNTDNIFNEVQTSKFDDNFIIEAYLDNYEGYSPGSDLMTKFGVRLKNEIKLIISRERFEEFIAPFLDGIQTGIDKGNITDQEILLTSRPREGDLIYFPLGERLFEVKRIEHEKPFYQLGKNYVYELDCELFEYENEDIDTDIDAIDKLVEDIGYITTLTLAGVGVTATATSTIGDGVVSKVVLTNDGSFYSATPTVTITPSPSGNPADDAKAVAITTSIGNVKSVESIRLTFGGRGYNVNEPPLVTITGGNGSGAAATCIVADGAVEFVTVTDVGSNYSIEPTVTFEDPPPYRGVLYGSWNTEFYISNAGGTVTGSNGSGYSPGTYNLTGGSGSGATLTVTQSSGAITGATGGLSFATGGQNYEVGDVLLIDGGNRNSYIRVGLTTIRTPGPGTTATARAEFNPINGTISSIQIVNAGSGYTEAPTVQISSASTVSIGGTYSYNETVIGSLSGTTAEVRHYKLRSDLNVINPLGELRVAINDGQFFIGESIIGTASSATYILKSYDNDNYDDSYDRNEIFEKEGDDIIDFTESNPFGEV